MLLLAACGDREVAVRLRAVDSLMDTRADSALAVLSGWQDEAAGWSQGQRMRYALLRAKAQNKAGVDFTSDSTMLRVVSYYDGWLRGTARTILGHSAAVHNDRLLSHYLLGCVYRDLGQVPRAIDCYLDAIAQADTTAADCDYKTLSAVYSQMAWLYHKQLLITNEVQARKQSVHYALIDKDTLNAIYEKGLIASSYILLNKRDSAELLLCETMRQYRALGYEQEALKTSTRLMYLYVDQPNHLSDLKQLIEQYEDMSNLFDEHHEPPPSKRQFYYYKGKFFEGINRLDSAEYYYRKVYRPNMAYTSLNPMYKGLLSVFSKRHQADSIAKYAKLYCLSTDSSVIIKDQQQTAQLAASYDYHYYQEQAYKNEVRAYRNWLAFIIALLAAVLIVCLAVYLGRRYKQMQESKRRRMAEEHRQVMEALTRQYQQKELLLQEKLHALEQLESAHQQVLCEFQQELQRADKRNKAYEEKLTALSDEYESKKSELTAEIADLTQEIERLKQHDLILASAEIARLFNKSDIHKRLQHVATHPLEALTEEEWTKLSDYFAATYPLLYHDLSSLPTKSKVSRERVCLLAAMGFSNGEIANLLAVTKQSVTNNMSALNAQLFGESTATTFYSNLVKRYHLSL